jgi:hypothetical protein
MTEAAFPCAGMITCTPCGKATTIADGGDIGTDLIIRTAAERLPP